MSLRIALMAKAPTVGLAKTRLAPTLGAAGAAALAERLFDHAVAQAAAAAPGRVTVWATPDVSHPVFERACLQHGVALLPQCEGDLGARMAHVFASAFALEPAPLLLMGSDLPALDAPMLRAAGLALRSHDVVFVPALDGGYGLVGLRAASAATLQALFDGMRWSTEQVMAETRLRLAAIGVQHAELPAVADIDVAADLQHLPPGWLQR